MPKTTQPHPLLAAFVESGATDEQIARHYGVNSRTIERWRLAEGLKPNWERRRYGHGTFARYSRGCRCDLCRSANNERHAKQRQDRRERGLPPGDPRHGRVTAATNWGCQCDICRAAVQQRNAAAYAARRGDLVMPRWSAEHTALVADQRLSAKEVAERTGRTMESIYAKRSRILKAARS